MRGRGAKFGRKKEEAIVALLTNRSIEDAVRTRTARLPEWDFSVQPGDHVGVTFAQNRRAQLQDSGFIIDGPYTPTVALVLIDLVQRNRSTGIPHHRLGD